MVQFNESFKFLNRGIFCGQFREITLNTGRRFLSWGHTFSELFCHLEHILFWKFRYFFYVKTNFIIYLHLLQIRHKIKFNLRRFMWIIFWGVFRSFIYRFHWRLWFLFYFIHKNWSEFTLFTGWPFFWILSLNFVFYELRLSCWNTFEETWFIFSNTF